MSLLFYLAVALYFTTYHKENEDKYIVFGLRKIYNNVYVPTTLHEGRGVAIYKSYRQTEIKNITWL